MFTRLSMLCGGALVFFPLWAGAGDLIHDDNAMAISFSEKLGAMVDKGQSMKGKDVVKALEVVRR